MKQIFFFLVVHEGRRDWKCEHCGKAFSINNNLLQHVKRLHENGVKDKICDSWYVCFLPFFIFCNVYFNHFLNFSFTVAWHFFVEMI